MAEAVSDAYRKHNLNSMGLRSCRAIRFGSVRLGSIVSRFLTQCTHLRHTALTAIPREARIRGCSSAVERPLRILTVIQNQCNVRAGGLAFDPPLLQGLFLFFLFFLFGLLLSIILAAYFYVRKPNSCEIYYDSFFFSFFATPVEETGSRQVNKDVESYCLLPGNPYTTTVRGRSMKTSSRSYLHRY